MKFIYPQRILLKFQVYRQIAYSYSTLTSQSEQKNTADIGIETNHVSNNLAYSHGPSLIPLLGETIGENLRKTVEKYSNNDALIAFSSNYKLTYQQLWDQITRLSKGLIHMGIRKGDRVGMWSPNRFEWIIVQFATARIGAILVNINPSYRIHELEYVLNHAQVKLIIAAKHFKTSDYEQLLYTVHPNCLSLEKIIIIENDWHHLMTCGITTISDRELDEIEAKLQFDDPINIQYTSGTTGKPKGVTLSHHNLLNNAYFGAKRLRYTANDRICVPVPFYHCFGMIIGNLASATCGACIVIPSEAFDPEQVMKCVSQEKCTSLYGVPTMFIAQLDHPNFKKYDFNSLRTGVMAGTICPVETMKQVQQQMNMKEVGICYGMTETSPVSVQTFHDDSLEKRVTTVGKAFDHVEIKIVNPNTNETVRRNETGELLTRGYHVMLGYWNDRSATEKTIDQARWLKTGDSAIMDDEGYIRIVGRIKDLIIRGGENIYPIEIENFLYRHPAVSDVQIIGIPSRKYGEEVMAWVRLKSEVGEISDKDLIEFCSNQISHYKIPKYWKFVQDFPQTISGKIRKVEMREISIQELNLKNEKN
ncbi:unnamed protein product [Didymodactylos carnosus]|uniref:Medium-chain acyl-CoA ligase ACSF2, mitochondrial n=1 Tax=Didymodactylos carnosus TaxID=1234261 RepID=A0A8S2H550_9BILA|nr:unnamed protein product [Didymodactylos carnosus]CAF3600283.1 unnamed protein product [Didymodactylos carnosus]